jgi:hypothetical protein
VSQSLLAITSHAYDNNCKFRRVSSGIKFRDMPRTFQDAITVTRMLGVAFLWVDSLYIVQDEEEDWLHESKLMADIFSGGYLTLAATRGTSSTASMFHTETDKVITGTSGTGQPYRISFHRMFMHARFQGFFTQDKREAQASSFPLLSRGWVFQERLLSPRMLHFGPTELFWECYESNMCECGERPLWSEEGYSKRGYLKVLEEASRDKIAIAWRNMLI